MKNLYTEVHVSKYFIISVLLITAAASATLGEKSIPEFYTVDMDNNKVALSDFLGEGPVVMAFWDSTCKPCKNEQPHLDKLYEEYKDQGLKVLAISVDSAKTVGDVKPYIKGNGYKFTVLLDVDNTVRKSCGVQFTPHTFLLDNTGKVIYEKMGYTKGDENVLEEKIVEYLESLQEQPDTKAEETPPETETTEEGN